MSETWAFITGMPRTGTTAMMQLLNLHPDCTILRETHFPQALHDLCCLPLSHNSGHYRFPLPDRAGVLCSLPRLQQYGAGMDMARAMCEGLRAQFGSPAVFGDKTPIYCFHWRTLRALWPDCRILIMDRELDEVAESLCRQSWGPNDIDQGRAEALRYRNALRGCPQRQRIWLPDLRSDPAGVMMGVLHHLNLPLDSYPMDEAVALVNGPPVS